MIDELPLVAVLGVLAEGQTVIRDASELRVKESDRVAVMVENLTSLGADVTEQPDGMIINGPTKVVPTRSIRSYGGSPRGHEHVNFGLVCRRPCVYQQCGLCGYLVSGILGATQQPGSER